MLVLCLRVQLTVGTTARTPVRAQAATAARRDVLRRRRARLAGLTRVGPFLVHRACRDLLGLVLVAATAARGRSLMCSYCRSRSSLQRFGPRKGIGAPSSWARTAVIPEAVLGEPGLPASAEHDHRPTGHVDLGARLHDRVLGLDRPRGGVRHELPVVTPTRWRDGEHDGLVVGVEQQQEAVVGVLLAPPARSRVRRR